MKNKVGISIFRLTLLCFIPIMFVQSNVLAAKPLTNNTTDKLSSESSEEMIFRDPWLAYEALLTQEVQHNNSNTNNYLWWLVRKAQAENLLYFYLKFDQTLALIKPLLSNQVDNEIQARYYFYQGLSVQRQGNYKQARGLFEQSMSAAEKVGNNRVYIRAKQELAYTYSLADLYDTSLKDLQEAFVEAFAIEDQYLIATINETYGAIYGYMNRYKRSLEYYQKALDTYERLNYKAHIAEAIYGLASTYRYWKKYDQAIVYFKRYQEAVNYTPNTNISYFSAYGLGMTYAEKGDCVNALTYIDQAFALKGLDDYDAELYKRKASCHITLGELNKAELAIKASEAIFDTMPELLGTAWELENQKIRGHLAFAKGNFKLAYQTLEQYYEAYSQALIDNSTSRVNNIRASLELERQEVERALSKQRQKATDLATENREQKAKQQSYIIVFLITLLVVVIIVVTFQYKHNIQITALTRVDPLTGLYNRRYCFEKLDALLEKTIIDKGALTVILFDVDDFKAINDLHGHPIGDKVLVEIAKIAEDSCRPGDIVGRIGGEEFMCVLPRTDNEQGMKVAQRIRQSFEMSAFRDDSQRRISVTASFGVCTTTEPKTKASALYAKADKALYAAKLAGKNCVKDSSIS